MYIYIKKWDKISSPEVKLWCPGAVPLKREALVKFAISVQRCCPAVFNDVSPQTFSKRRRTSLSCLEKLGGNMQ